MAVQQPQLQWDIWSTSTSAIEVGRGVLHAATTDNVQVLAIVACERFGNTIAMSRDAVLKIQKSVVPAPLPALLNFVNVSIGYSAGDCAALLGQNIAGLQFLALAAALVTSMGSFKSSTAIQAMLASTAKDKTLLPTVEQVRGLLDKIEPRCHASGFADDVGGWQLLLNKFSSDGFSIEDRALYGGMMYFPKCQGVENLVDALRQLRRLGNDDITKVTIRTTACAPWTIAFVKWSLGYPPSVVLDNGDPIVEQPGSEVTVVIMRQGDRGMFAVTMHSSIDGLSDLVESKLDEMVTGMVNLRTYGDLLQWRYGFQSDGLAARAVQQAMPYALDRAVKGLVFWNSGFSDGSLTTEYPLGMPNDLKTSMSLAALPRMKLRLSPFPDDRSISSMYYLLFEQELELCPMDPGIGLTDLPVMALHLRTLKEEFQCAGCYPAGGDGAVCKLVRFRADFSVVVADILALSLFDNPEGLRVSNILHRPHRNNSNEFVKAIQLTVEYGAAGDCNIVSLLNWGLQLVGHNVKQLEGKSWVMTSYKGQTIWPKIYDTHVFAKRGFLSLYWLPGLIRYKNQVYSRAFGPDMIQIGADPVTGTCQENVSGPRNLCHGMELEWNVVPDEDGIIVTTGVRDGTKKYGLAASCPTLVLTSLSNAFLVEECCHGPDANLVKPDIFSAYTGPLKPFKSSGDDGEDTAGAGAVSTLSFRTRFTGSGSGSAIEWTPFAAAPAHWPGGATGDGPKGKAQEVSVVAVDGNDDLRFLALSNNQHRVLVMLRGRTCLACSLDACRNADCTALVL